MRYLLILLIVAFGDSAFAQNHSSQSPSHDCIEVPRDSAIIDGLVVYVTADERAQFTGGDKAMLNYISSTINYPPSGICDGFIYTKV